MVIYSDPDGVRQMNPDAEFIKDTLNRGLDYWCDEASFDIVGYDSSSSNISFHDGSSIVYIKNAPSLMFFKVEKYGFFIMELSSYNAPYKQIKLSCVTFRNREFGEKTTE